MKASAISHKEPYYNMNTANYQKMKVALLIDQNERCCYITSEHRLSNYAAFLYRP